MDKIINGIIDDFGYDIIFSKFKEKLSETQIQSIINKIKKIFQEKHITIHVLKNC